MAAKTVTANVRLQRSLEINFTEWLPWQAEKLFVPSSDANDAHRPSSGTRAGKTAGALSPAPPPATERSFPNLSMKDKAVTTNDRLKRSLEINFTEWLPWQEEKLFAPSSDATDARRPSKETTARKLAPAASRRPPVLKGMPKKAKRCSTPGCEFSEYHLGPCGGFCDSKRARVCATPKSAPMPLSLALRKDPYDTNAVKQTHREYVVAAAKDSDKPILYLDSGFGGCTKYLVSRGIDPKRLRPCNSDAAMARSIEQETGVPCIVADIVEHAARADPWEFGVAWFDMCGVSLDVDQVAHVAQHLMITLNCRGVGTTVQESNLVSNLKALDFKVVNHGCYAGTGGVVNMVYAFAKTDKSNVASKKRADSPTSVDSDDSDPSDADLQWQQRELSDNAAEWMHVPLRVPTSRWEKHNVPVDPSLYRVIDGCLLATVVDIKGSRLFLKYQTIGGRMMPDQMSLENKIGKVTPKEARAWRW